MNAIHSLLSLILSFLLVLPACGQDAPKTKKTFDLNASQTHLNVSPDWATSDQEDRMLPDKLTPLIPGYAKQPQIQETSVTKVNIPESHGEVAVGVLGAYTEDYDGSITKIMSGSDLLRLGIVIGDKIKKIDGKEYKNADEFRNACRGLPGSTMILVIERNGQTAPYIVKRTDARLYVDDQDGYYKWCVNQMKRW